MLTNFPTQPAFSWEPVYKLKFDQAPSLPPAPDGAVVVWGPVSIAANETKPILTVECDQFWLQAHCDFGADGINSSVLSGVVQPDGREEILGSVTNELCESDSTVDFTGTVKGNSVTIFATPSADCVVKGTAILTA
jgi:hypothetical protein